MRARWCGAGTGTERFMMTIYEAALKGVGMDASCFLSSVFRARFGFMSGVFPKFSTKGLPVRFVCGVCRCVCICVQKNVIFPFKVKEVDEMLDDLGGFSNPYLILF